MNGTWSEAAPNLLIGLREGLEAGLVVSILVGAVRRLAPERRLTDVWTGVAAAVTLSLSFGFVLTYTATSLSPKAQDIFDGTVSLLAVALVTTMVFWMRKAARALSGDLRSKVGSALSMGGLALVLTAFLAVAREGLETALFVWSSVQAAGSSRVAPLLGALAGLLVAVLLCVLIYRRAVAINLGKFFTRTGSLLIVIAAGVLAYGLGDLQGVDALPGGSANAFDLSAHVSADSWWVTLIRGVFNITPTMTWLQVGAYLAYIAVVMTLFLRHARSAKPAAAPAPAAPAAPATPAVAAAPAGAATAQVTARAEAPDTAEATTSTEETATTESAAPEPAAPEPAAPEPAAPEPAISESATSDSDADTAADAPSATDTAPSSDDTTAADPTAGGSGSDTNADAPAATAPQPPRRRRVVAIGAVAVLLPVLAAAIVVAVLPSRDNTTAATITLTDSACAAGWTAPAAGSATFTIDNQAGHGGEIYLLHTDSGAVVGELEGLGPGTRRTMTASLSDGRYTWKCILDGLPVRTSTAETVSGSGGNSNAVAFVPVTDQDLAAPVNAYRQYVTGKLAALQDQVRTVQQDVAAGNRAQAQTDWTTAHITWHQVGAAYGAFGDLQADIDGTAAGLTGGVNDPDFHGFHKLEYDLWTTGDMAAATTDANDLVTNVGTLNTQFAQDTIDPSDLGLRTHEILEDSLRDELTANDDYGSGTDVASLQGDVDGTRTLLGILTPLLNNRAPGLVTTATADLDRIDAAIQAVRPAGGGWTGVRALSLAQRQQLDSAVGQALETLAPVADLLEVRPT